MDILVTFLGAFSRTIIYSSLIIGYHHVVPLGGDTCIISFFFYYFRSGMYVDIDGILGVYMISEIRDEPWVICST